MAFRGEYCMAIRVAPSSISASSCSKPEMAPATPTHQPNLTKNRGLYVLIQLLILATSWRVSDDELFDTETGEITALRPYTVVGLLQGKSAPEPFVDYPTSEEPGGCRFPGADASLINGMPQELGSVLMSAAGDSVAEQSNPDRIDRSFGNPALSVTWPPFDTIDRDDDAAVVGLFKRFGADFESAFNAWEMALCAAKRAEREKSIVLAAIGQKSVIGQHT